MVIPYHRVAIINLNRGNVDHEFGQLRRFNISIKTPNNHSYGAVKRLIKQLNHFKFINASKTFFTIYFCEVDNQLLNTMTKAQRLFQMKNLPRPLFIIFASFNGAGSDSLAILILTVNIENLELVKRLYSFTLK